MCLHASGLHREGCYAAGAWWRPGNCTVAAFGCGVTRSQPAARNKGELCRCDAYSHGVETHASRWHGLVKFVNRAFAGNTVIALLSAWAYPRTDGHGAAVNANRSLRSRVMIITNLHYHCAALLCALQARCAPGRTERLPFASR